MEVSPLVVPQTHALTVVQIPVHLQQRVRHEVRAFLRLGDGEAPTELMRRRRKRLGQEITQWRKAQGNTEATSRLAPAMIADLQGQLAAAHGQLAALQLENEALRAAQGGEDLGTSMPDAPADPDAVEDEEFAGFGDDVGDEAEDEGVRTPPPADVPEEPVGGAQPTGVTTSPGGSLIRRLLGLGGEQ